MTLFIERQGLTAEGERLEVAAILRRIVGELDDVCRWTDDYKLRIEGAMETLSMIAGDLDPDDAPRFETDALKLERIRRAGTPGFGPPAKP